MQKILLLEDDTTLGNGIRLTLQSPSVLLTLCRTLTQAQNALAQNSYDLLILDINLPDGSGLELLEQIRQSSNLPVILLTANDMEMDIVTGLESGADDYITKPFSLAILRARVNAQLRRGMSRKTSCIEIDRFQFDFDRMEFRKDGQSMELSKTEQKLLRILVENRGLTLPRATLVDRIWTDGAEYVDENALSVTVKRLRDKLEDTPSSPQYLKTVYGIGYTWAVK
ncbi:MAG: response regulator transcription factor [Faecousia sp.]